MLIGVIVLISFEISTVGCMGDEKKSGQTGISTKASESVDGKPVDAKQQILNDAKKTARNNYINTMREEFINNGVEASISGFDGDLVIVSDLFKLKSHRDQVVRQQFGPPVKRNLCTMGFKTLALKSGALLGAEDSYSLGCPETKEEKDSRLKALQAKRQKLVDDLQAGYTGDSELHDVRIEQRGEELVMTAPFAKDMAPKTLRAMVGAEFDDASKRNLCGVGLRCLRVRSSPSSSGTLIPFNCGR